MREPGRAEPLYAVLGRWVAECVRGDGSLLEPGTIVWSEENLASMKSIWIDNPDTSDRDFALKAADELAGAPREVKLLAAEVRAVQLMPMAEVSAASKRKEIDELLSAGGVSVQYPDDVAAALEHGLANYGMAKVHKYWHLCLIIDRLLAVKKLTVDDRETVLSDPWEWKRFVRANDLPRVGSQENMLFHIVHPSEFEPIPSGADKRLIATALEQYAEGESDQDVALLTVHRKLIEERGGWVNFWDDEVRALWDPDAQAQREADEQEVAWQQAWADWLVSSYEASGGSPTVPDSAELAKRIRVRLEELGRTGDVDGWLTSLRNDRESLRNLRQGAHSRTHRSIVRESQDPLATARTLSEIFVAPGDDEEAAEKIRRLETLTSDLQSVVKAALLASNVWHMQDPTIPPIWRSVEAPLAARGWYEAPSDNVEHYLSYTEFLSGLGVDVRYLSRALSSLAESRHGLPGLHASLFDRCAAAATEQPTSLKPVVADLETLAEHLRRNLDLPEHLTLARSQTRQLSSVWVELRDRDRPVIRLWVDSDGLVVLRPADGAVNVSSLTGFTESGGAPAVAPHAPTWIGERLDRGAAAKLAEITTVARSIVEAGDADDELAALFAEFVEENGGGDDAVAVEQERQELARHLTVDALIEPDLDGLRQIINTSRYGGPGPMPALNSTLSEAAAAGELDRIGATLVELCHGAGTLEDRIDAALASGIRGLGQSVIMKLLAITHPERIIPVFPLLGDQGKVTMLEALGLPTPPESLSPGARQIAANDALVAKLRPFTQSMAQARSFLYFVIERAGLISPEGDDSEDRLANVVTECYVPRTWVDEAVGLLRERHQLVFYGPPGTGKTYVALKLAEALAADPARRRLVQFHPAYSYEDFFEGYRPRPAESGLVYELVPGPLKQMAEAARRDPRRDYVLVVDEINRANLPKVFGELLFLLEYRDRTASTMYGGEEFGLPANLYIIATMNTADRSIALVDAALRRRFHFMPFFPDRAPFNRTLHDWLTRHDEPRWIAQLLDHVNSELVDRLGGPHIQIGPSHFMQRGIGRKLERIWRYTIEPLLEEQLFGDDRAIEDLRFDAVRKRFGPSAVAAAPEDEDATVVGTTLADEEDGGYDDAGKHSAPGTGTEA
jgi:5-methylcytosine-specific restriction enzyme B